MATAKIKLKAARTAIGNGDFSAAQKASLEVLEEDPSNYNASVCSPI
jgi:Tfp pilus assembly protein PilF